MPFTITQFVGLFNILVGLMLTTSVLLLGAGTIMWVARLGTAATYRDDAIKMLQWSIGILFSLIILLLFSQFVQQHTSAAVSVLGLIILGVIAWLIRQAYIESKVEHE